MPVVHSRERSHARRVDRQVVDDQRRRRDGERDRVRMSGVPRPARERSHVRDRDGGVTPSRVDAAPDDVGGRSPSIQDRSARAIFAVVGEGVRLLVGRVPYRRPDRGRDRERLRLPCEEPGAQGERRCRGGGAAEL